MTIPQAVIAFGSLGGCLNIKNDSPPDGTLGWKASACLHVQILWKPHSWIRIKVMTRVRSHQLLGRLLGTTVD